MYHLSETLIIELQEHDPRIEIFLIQIFSLARAIFCRNHAVANAKCSVRNRPGFFLSPGALQNTALFVVGAGGLGIVMGVRVEDLESLIQQSAALCHSYEGKSTTSVAQAFYLQRCWAVPNACKVVRVFDPAISSPGGGGFPPIACARGIELAA